MEAVLESYADHGTVDPSQNDGTAGLRGYVY